MNREYARREKHEIVKLIVISMIVIFMYLAVSFEEVYGYQVTSLLNIEQEYIQPINWKSDLWLEPDNSEDLFYSTSFDNSGGINNSFQDSFNNFDSYSDINTTNSIPTIPEPGLLLLFGIGLGGLRIARKFIK